MEISTERLREIVFQAAGAATRPFMEDDPDAVMPSERVTEGVNGVLMAFGIPTEGEAERVPGLSEARVLEIVRAEGLTRPGESAWVRDGFVVIGPGGRKPHWLPPDADGLIDEAYTDEPAG